jgi:hypothetical protein
LAFLFLNPNFGGIPAALYTLTCWAVLAPLDQFGIRQFWEAACTALESALTSQAGMLWLTALCFGIWLTTDSHKKLFRIAAAGCHFAAHLSAVFLLGWFSARIWWEHGGFRTPQHMFVSGVIVFAGGWIVGSEIMGVYLWASLNLFGRHQNEAFSSLRIADYKSFLRMHIDRDGVLTIYAIGIARIPRVWRQTVTSGGVSQTVPQDARATSPGLIEKITIS